MNKTVAIVGTHPATRDNAPFDDPNKDIWVFNEVAGKDVKQDDGTFRPWAWRVSAVFQMHLPLIYRSLLNRSDPKHWEWLQKEQDFPVYMLEADPEVPSSVKYPLEEVVDAFLDDFKLWDKETEELVRVEYFTSSIAYTFALAALKGYEHIEVYGIEMSSNTEYIFQRDCVAFWEGVCLGRGIAIDNHCGWDIFKRPLYGYNGIVDHRPEDFEKNIILLERQATDWRMTKNKAEETLYRSWEMGDFSNLISELANAHSQLGMVEGRLSQEKKYKHKIQSMYDEFGMGYIDRNEFEGAAAGERVRIEQTTREVMRTAGHIDIMMNSWNHSRNPASLEQLKVLVKKHLDVCYEAGLYQGVYEENARLAHHMDQLIRATGGRKAVEMVAEEMGYVIPELDGEPRQELAEASME